MNSSILYRVVFACVPQDESLLKGRIQLIEVGVNSVLGLEGDQECCVYFIASGRLKVYHLTGDQSKSQVEELPCTLHPTIIHCISVKLEVVLRLVCT